MAPAGEDALRALVLPVVAAAGFDLEGMTTRAASGVRIVQVVVDRDGGVDIDAAAALSRTISARLDESADSLFGGAPYTLEVTSPGIGSALTEPRHFRRAVGRLVRLDRRDGAASVVRLARVDDDDVAVLGGADGRTPSVIPFSEIASARVEPEFAHPSAEVAALLARMATAPAGRAAEHHEEEGAR